MKEYTIVQDNQLLYHHGYYARLFYLKEEKDELLERDPENNWWINIPMFLTEEAVKDYVDWRNKSD